MKNYQERRGISYIEGGWGGEAGKETLPDDC